MTARNACVRRSDANTIDRIHMTHRTCLNLWLIVLAALLPITACGPSEPVRFETIQLGRALNPDNSVGAHTTRFKPDDTVYVALLSEHPGSGTVTVRWKLNGQTVSEGKRDVSYTRAAATEFHLQNSGGFPPGSYRVEILVNDQPAGTREFRVEK